MSALFLSDIVGDIPPKRLISKNLTDIEVAFNRRHLPEAVINLLDGCLLNVRARIIGVSGSPGAGKSALSACLCAKILEQGKSAAVIAVDPSSQMTGGAVLGDRVRFQGFEVSDRLFFRSLSSGDCFGGLARSVFGMTLYLAGLFDYVFVETVGVGQTEIDVRRLADIVLYCVQPGAGDLMQFIKAGVMETPDIFAVTKADFGPQADKAYAEIKSALSLGATDKVSNRVIRKVSAQTGEGVETLIEDFAQFSPRDKNEACDFFFEKIVTELYGAFGLARYREQNAKYPYAEDRFKTFQERLSLLKQGVRFVGG